MKERQLLKVTPYKQSRPAFCGPAALRTLISYFRVKKSETELAHICETNKQDGTNPRKLIKALRKLGFKIRSGEFGNYKILDYYVNKRKLPVLVDWWKEDDGHYSVVCGLNKDFVWVADPGENRNRIIKKPWVVFQRNWQDFEGDVLENKQDIYLRWWLVAYK